MRYVTQKNNRYYYQRGYPARVVDKAPSRYFSMVLDAKTVDSEVELAKAVAVASEAFEIEVRRLENSDAQTSVRDRVAERLTKRSKRSAQTPKRLSQLWKPYCSFRNVQQDGSKRYKQTLSNWNRALAFIGDHPLVRSTDGDQQGPP